MSKKIRVGSLEEAQAVVEKMPEGSDYQIVIEDNPEDPMNVVEDLILAAEARKELLQEGDESLFISADTELKWLNEQLEDYYELKRRLEK